MIMTTTAIMTAMMVMVHMMALMTMMATVNMLQPQGVKVVSAMAMVRNSVGSDCYVADEIITSRAGVRIRVGNTDAEGRMAMVDVLCHAKEKALKDPSKEYFSTQLVPSRCCAQTPR